jgi:hypothetical protein
VSCDEIFEALRVAGVAQSLDSAAALAPSAVTQLASLAGERYYTLWCGIPLTCVYQRSLASQLT